MNHSPAVRKNDLLPSDTPGLGVAGLVLCPFTKGACMKSACELWLELSYGETKVGRCSYVWDALVKVEIRQELTKLRETIAPKNKEG